MKKVVSLSVLLIMVLALTSTASPAQSTPIPIRVKMVGHINSYGGNVAAGMLVAHAKIDEWAKVRAFYVPRLNFTPHTFPHIIPANLTVSFHAVKLVNAFLVKLNYMDNDFYILGLWDVIKITIVHHDLNNFTVIIQPLVIHGRGELNVTGTWTDFTLDIVGNNLVKGKVLFFAVVGGLKPIPIGDVSGGPFPGIPDQRPGIPDRRIDIRDLVHVARAYGSTPGDPWTPNYAFSADFDFDVDNPVSTVGVGLGELTTIASNLGTEY